MRTAIVLGGTGVLGEPTARRLADDGWRVTVASRGRRVLPASLRERGVSSVQVDRRDAAAVQATVGEGVDLFVDIIPFDAVDARQLQALRGYIGALVVVSSAAIYADDCGRPLLTYRDEPSPERPVPLRETQPVVAPDETTYRGRKASVEQVLLEAPPAPVTILRPPAVYGPQDTLAREWHFLKRALDLRPRVVLALGGESRLHVVAAENVAELVRLAAERPATRVVNAADPWAPTSADIGATIASFLDHSWEEIRLSGPPRADLVGDNPWCVRRPFVLDVDRARQELGYSEVLSFETGIEQTCSWLLDAVRGGDWRQMLPKTAIWCQRAFDYEAEDRLAARLAWRARVAADRASASV